MSENINNEIIEEIDDEEVYVEYDITSYPADLTVSVIEDMWKNGDIVIPDFQRNYVWGIKQASLLIESFLLGLPIPQLFLYVDEDNKNLVIDGQQRLMSTLYYLEGFFGKPVNGYRTVFKLTGLSAKSPYNNKEYKELPEAQQRKLKMATLRAVIIRQMKPMLNNSSAYHIFERLNTGGTPLKPQEIRNCVYRGVLAEKLSRLNENEFWRKVFGSNDGEKHQKDKELILRVLAFVELNKVYSKPMKEFLNNTMSFEKTGKSILVNDFYDRFPLVCKMILDKLGEKPFHLRGPLNSSALDAVMSTLIRNFHSIPNDLAQRWKNLKNDPVFIAHTSLSTSDENAVKERRKIAQHHLIANV